MVLDSQNYFEHLGKVESSNNYKAINTMGYIGKYQMGEPALVDSGYYTKKTNYADYKNQWDMPFTGRMGVKSKKDFLNNQEAQEDAVRRYHNYIWKQIKEIAEKNHGKTINGIKMTYSGMFAGAYLVGPGELKKYKNWSDKEKRILRSTPWCEAPQCANAAAGEVLG